MKIVVVGSGYVGLVSGACFAEIGHEVVCVDKDANKISALRAGDVPIFEPGLSDLVLSNVKAGRLHFENSIGKHGLTADAIFIAVGTPPRASDHGADLSFVFSVAEEIAGSVGKRAVVVTKSTVPIGTGDKVERIIRTLRPELDLAVVSNPEFLREGSAIGDFMSPDRIVVGSENDHARHVMAELYRPLTEKGAPILFSGRRAAELIKYASNAFLATKISFINEMADLCEATGADVREVSGGMGLDKRIGRAFLEAGPGYGGSCFPKDSTALLVTAQNYAVNLRIVESTIAANDARKRAMARRVISAVGGDLHNKTVAVLGLTFKPNTDDMREAPSIAIISALQHAGATIRAYDPEGMDQARQFLSNVHYAKNAYDCAENVDCIVLTTEWDELKKLDLSRLAKTVGERVIVDLRNAFDPAALQEHGFVVHSIGRKNPVAADRMTTALMVKRGLREPGFKKKTIDARTVQPAKPFLSVKAMQAT